MKGGFLLSLLPTTVVAAPFPEHYQLQAARPIPNYPGLQFNPDKKLSVTVFSDLHFSEPKSGSDGDWKSVGVIDSVLNNEYSDLVVLNGDLISCEWVAPQDANGIIDKIIGPIVNRNLPFAATFGNHDASKTCSTRAMSDHMWNDVKGANGQKLSFTSNSVDGPVEQVGWSNYYIPVYSATDNNKLAMLIWFFDSKGGRVYQPEAGDISVANWVDEKVVYWFRSTRDEFRQQNGRVIPSLAFVHIPVQAAATFQKSEYYTKTTEPGLNQELIGTQSDCGENCYTGMDAPFMKALVETEGLIAVFSGHDHGVDWCMKWAKNLPKDPTNSNGISFCFNRHSGYGGYSDWTRGGRKILIEEGKDELETWIRLEDGSVSGRVMLNATYGTDQYPEVKQTTSSGARASPGRL